MAQSAKSIQSILSLARSGQTLAALSSARKLLQKRPADLQLRALCGSLYCQAGQIEQGVKELQKVVAQRPDLIQARLDLGRGLRLLGRYAAAVDHLKVCAQRPGPHVSAAVNELALSFRSDGQAQRAVQEFERGLKLQPGHPGLTMNYANTLQMVGRHAEATKLYQVLAERHGNNASLSHQLGRCLVAMGQPDQAVNQLKQSLSLEPGNNPVRMDLIRALLANRYLSEANHELQQLLDAKPADSLPWYELGFLARELGQPDVAQQCYQSAISQGDHVLQSWRDRVAAGEEFNQLDQAWDAVQQGLQHFPGDSELTLLKARLLRRRGDFEEAHSTLSELAPELDDPRLKTRLAYDMVQVCDRLQRPAEVWDWAHQRAEIQKQALRLITEENYFDQAVQYWRQWLEAGAAPDAPPQEGTSPVFLFGFPRSGTTLVDQFLDGHSGLQTLEERSLLDRLIQDNGGFQAVMEQAAVDPSALIEEYWEFASRETALEEGCRLVERMPSNFLHVPLIQRLWPGAPMIFVQRHPADVCLSCLMQDFRLNALSSHFLGMQETLDFYRDTMQLWQQYSQRYSEQIFSLRYEALVENAEPMLKDVIDWLGLSWEPAVLDHVATAGKRPEIRTASYHQAGQPLYQHARYRWRRFETQLQPWLSELNSLAAESGYDPV